MSRRRRAAAATAMAVVALASSPAASGFDLARARVERLDNGLTVILLEERALPLVSVQMLYKVGARDEPAGRTGLAHFVEHMAFRASERFPGTELVSRIYAAGGEWHGYTWIDQTTYYETLPAEELDLALDIEADRMARLLLPAAELEAERGAVLAELQGYQNDPATVLKETVVATSFLQHPYRNNTIGWPSDVERLRHRDVVAFYRRRYRPANAVLAVVGDLDAADVLGRVRRRFGGLPGGRPSPLPRTVEPPQQGERRVHLRLPAGAGRFEIAYRAPAAADPDYPAFLLLQELLGGTGGVSFLQDTFGVAVGEGTRLAGAAEELATWFPPSAQPYVFTVAGVAGATPRGEVESEIERRLAKLRQRPVGETELAAATRRLAAELVFDLETTEDAAHQLAFFAGIGALDVLRELPERLVRVTPEEVRRVAATYLHPDRRTIGWVVGTNPEAAPAASEPPRPRDEPRPLAHELPKIRVATAARPGPPSGALGPPAGWRLAGGLPVSFQRSELSASGYLLVLLPATTCDFGGRARPDEPVWRHTAVGFRFLVDAAGPALRQARELVDACRAADGAGAAGPAPPAERTAGQALDDGFEELLGIGEPPRGGVPPVLLALAGALDEAAARRLTAEHFGDLAPGVASPAPPPAAAAGELRIRLPHTVQARLGYAVPAPAPAEPEAAAWRMLLYVLSHDYEGRLGVAAIGRRGLVYFIDSNYHCDGRAGWISLAAGVDPAKLEPLRELVGATLAGLVTAPPSERELAEARAHLLGRRRTAAQSNRELTERLARDAVCHGGPLSEAAYRRQLEAVGAAEIARILPAFTGGGTVVVE